MILWFLKKKLNKRLQKAVFEHDMDEVQEAVKKGADVNFSEKPGLSPTPLMIASYNGNEECVRYLVNSGANVNTQHDWQLWDHNTWGLAPISSPEYPKPGRGDTALIRAATRGHSQIVRFLLENGADPNRKNRFGFTAVMCAAIDNPYRFDDQVMPASMKNPYGPKRTNADLVDVVKLLLEHGADVDVQSDDGKTALDLANKAGYSDIAELLKSF